MEAHPTMPESKRQTVKEAIAVVEKAHVFLAPAQTIFGLAHDAMDELQRSSNKSKAKKAKVIVGFAKKATAVAVDASRKHQLHKKQTGVQGPTSRIGPASALH